MMSFFSKKKNSPDTPTEEVIQGPANPTATNEDEFVFIEKKPHNGPVYPPMPSFMNNPNGLPYPNGMGFPGHSGKQDSVTDPSSISYLQGVPFQLSSQLKTKSDFDGMQTQVDGVLAFLTRQISIDGMDYDFSLERSISSNCY